jgi:hypothetical protein
MEDLGNTMFKTLRTGATGLVTLSPTTQYFTYRLDILGNTTLNIDLQRMINQVGNARCRLIIDMPIIRTITITNPILWGGNPPTFAEAGQYIFEVIDVGGANTPLLWQVAATTKAQTTGNILYVDSTGADYTVGQINGETATRTTSTWSEPFKYLQNAINASVAGDIIFVKEGVHKPTHLRTSPTVYTDGDHLNRNATFSPKDSVDMYGGFVGTESKTWERIMDEDGYPVNPTILCGDIKGEAEIDPLKTAGDTRTDLSKSNAAYNVFMAQGRVTNITYLNGFEVRYGNANGDITYYTNSGGGLNCKNSLLVGINIKAYSNTATTNGGGWRDGTNTNCTAYSNTATNGGGWYLGTNTNCTGINNKGAEAVYGSTTSDTHINCLLFNNRNSSDTIVGFNNSAATGVKIFRNNAYDTEHPTITGGEGSDINLVTCLQNQTVETVKITLPTIIGATTVEGELVLLHEYKENIIANLRPAAGSTLIGAGVNDATYPNPTDFEGAERPENSTIGILEGENNHE